MGWGANAKAPDGRRWRVSRRWLERRPPRLRERLSGKRSAGDTGRLLWDGANIADAIGSIWGVGGAVIVVALLIVVVLPVLGLAVELVLLLLVLLFGLVGRLAFGRPWVVEAAPIDAGAGAKERERVTRAVRGWRASGEAITQMRREIEATGRPTADAAS